MRNKSARQTIKVGKSRLARLESIRVFTYSGRKAVRRAGIRKIEQRSL